MKLSHRKYIIGGSVAVIVFFLLTGGAPLAFAGGIAKVIVGMVISAIVGTVAAAITLNPGAGMAIALFVCVAICAPSNGGGGGGSPRPSRPIPPPSVIPSPSPSPSPSPAPSPTPSPSPSPSPSPAPLPSATLERCNETLDDCSSDSGWGVGDLTITTGHEVKLRWSSTNSTRCDGTGFETNGATSDDDGVDVTTVATPANSELVYTLICDDTDASTAQGSSNVGVTANDVAPTLTATDDTVRTGKNFTLEWNLNGNNPDTCSFTSGADAPTDVVTTDEATIKAVGTSTYTLQCAGGSDTITIQVTPQFYES